VITQDGDRAKTGIAGFDHIAKGGLIRDRLYLIDGNPGAGKTTFAMQFLLEGVRAGERCLYVTLSETRAELLAAAASHHWSLDGIEVAELITDFQEFKEQSDLTMLNPAEVELSETIREITETIERVKPARMVLDALSELRLLAQDSLRYRRQILALKQFFTGRGCTVLLLDDRTVDGPDAQLHSIAHAVISLDFTAPAYGTVRRAVQILKFRGSDFSSGYHDFAIHLGGISVYPRLVAADHKNDFGSGLITSGVQALDQLLGGGIERGTTTLLTGPPGCGKSTIALQYAVAATQRGGHAAAFIFDETQTALLTRSRGIGLPLRLGTSPGEVIVHQIDPAEVSPGQFAHTVREAVEKRGARVVVIDSLNGYLNAMPSGGFLTAQLHELLTYLNNLGVATFLVIAQGGMVGPYMTTPVDASYLADSVVLLRYFEHMGKIKKAISVLKKRTGAHEESIRELWFDSAGIHLSAPLLHLRGILSGVPVELTGAADARPPPTSRGT
jgi:circadian clock protein KaiC